MTDFILKAGLYPESQGKNLALLVINVPSLLGMEPGTVSPGCPEQRAHFPVQTEEMDPIPLVSRWRHQHHFYTENLQFPTGRLRRLPS